VERIIGSEVGSRGEDAANISPKMLPGHNAGGPSRLYPLMVAFMVGLSVVAILGMGTAYPHDPKRPELNAWFKSLKNKVGESCCDSGDVQHAEAEWDMAKSGYKVLLQHPHKPNEPGKWFDVPYSAVIEQPNFSGIAMVWWSPAYDNNGGMTPTWRCFIPGAGG
jgi:hypothetical protein